MIASYTYNALVTRVVDGDSLITEIDAGFRIEAEMPLRIAHIDAPEMSTVEGKAARGYLVALLGPLPVAVVVHTIKPVERWGRYLAEVYIGDLDVGADMVAHGHAVAYEGGAR